MIDITNFEKAASDFEGSERKFAIFYNNEVYMIKEPDPVREKNNELHYMNNTYSEYIGCKIFETLDIPVQETFLAKYTRPDGKIETVIACKDFREKGEQLYEADKFAKSLIDSSNITKPDLEDIQHIFYSVQPKLNENAEQRFWDTFVIDGLIGNPDRHLGNWGFLSKDRINFTLAPIYDCGSSLGALVSDKVIQKCLEKPGIMSNVECNLSARFLINGERVTYREVFNNPPEKLKKSMKEIIPKIDLTKIAKIINSTPDINESREKYIFDSLKMRYEQILLRSLKKLHKTELTQKVTEKSINKQKLDNKKSKE